MLRRPFGDTGAGEKTEFPFRHQLGEIESPLLRSFAALILPEIADSSDWVASNSDSAVSRAQRVIAVLGASNIGQRDQAHTLAGQISDPLTRVVALSLIGGDALHEARAVAKRIGDVRQRARAQLILLQATLGKPADDLENGSCIGFCRNSGATGAGLPEDGAELYGKSQVEYVTRTKEGATSSSDIVTSAGYLGLRGSMDFREGERRLIYRVIPHSADDPCVPGGENNYQGYADRLGTMLMGAHQPISYIAHGELIPLEDTLLSPCSILHLPRAPEPGVQYISPVFNGLQFGKRMPVEDKPFNDGAMIYKNGPYYISVASRLKPGLEGEFRGQVTQSFGLLDWNGISLSAVHYRDVNTTLVSGSDLLQLPITSATAGESLLTSVEIAIGDLSLHYYWTEETSESGEPGTTAQTVATRYRLSGKTKLFSGRRRVRETDSNGHETERVTESHGFSQAW